MKKLIIFCAIFFTFSSANAAEAKKDTPLKIASKEASECYQKVKDSKNLDDKMDCLFKMTLYLDMKSRKLQQDLLDLQLATTGY
jgi:Skp family chaperone for outer membrane proteins